MNDAQNLDNNRMRGLYMNQSGPSLYQSEVDPEDDILILVDEDDRDAAGTDRVRESSFLTYRTRERMARHETERQLKRRNLTIVLHHGKLNSLIRTWTLPKGLQMINLINMWLRGSTKDNVPPLLYLLKENFAHVKNGAVILSKTKQVMKKAE